MAVKIPNTFGKSLKTAIILIATLIIFSSLTVNFWRPLLISQTYKFCERGISYEIFLDKVVSYQDWNHDISAEYIFKIEVPISSNSTTAKTIYLDYKLVRNTIDLDISLCTRDIVANKYTVYLDNANCEYFSNIDSTTYYGWTPEKQTIISDSIKYPRSFIAHCSEKECIVSGRTSSNIDYYYYSQKSEISKFEKYSNTIDSWLLDSKIQRTFNVQCRHGGVS